MAWYKGNTHCHTHYSDGDSSIENVVNWYAKRKYDWLVITDHWCGLSREKADSLSAQFNILVIPGTEIGGSTHVVGVGVEKNTEYMTELDTDDHVASLQGAIEVVNNLNGIPVMAHPNWTYMWDSADALKTTGCNLFEVHNGSTDCCTFSAGGKKGTDDIWNEILNGGKLMYGVGSDDAHVHSYDGLCPEHMDANGATAWTLAECQSLTQENVINALKTGRIAASEGPRICDFGVKDGYYYVNILEHYEHFHYTTIFYGAPGILSEMYGLNPTYKIKGNEKWVRARSFCTSGRYLWTQPVII